MLSFGQRLKLLRREAKITQADLAEQLMVSVQSISKWECDNTMPDISQIVPLSAVLGVTTDCLLGVGINEKEDKNTLIDTIGKINHTYNYLTYENNRGYKQYEQYHEYLKKYPLDYEVKLECALSIYSFIRASQKGFLYKIPDKEYDTLFNEGIRHLEAIVNQDKNLTRKINANETLVQYYVENNDLEKAEAVAVDLPDQDNIKIKSMILVFNAKKDYEKCLELSNTMRSNAVCSYLDALNNHGRRISIFGDVRKLEAIDAWRIYEEAARYNYKLLRDDPANAKNILWHVLRSLWSRSNDCIAINDIDGAISAVEDMKDFGIEYYTFRKENGADKIELEQIIAWLHNSIKRCYMHSLGTPDNIIDNDPRFKACHSAINQLN